MGEGEYQGPDALVQKPCGRRKNCLYIKKNNVLVFSLFIYIYIIL